MILTSRQKDILNNLVAEYTDSALPVSSELLEKKYDFDVSPATIRIELQKLTEAGFITQPHTSAGRVPTDKGYRFFVNDLLEKEITDYEDFEFANLFDKKMDDTFRFLQILTKRLASFSSDLVVAYIADERLIWKEGWEEVLKEPEFKESDLIVDFTDAIKSLEANIDSFDIESKINVFIGKENPFPKSKEFSMVIARCRFPEHEEGFLALFGPKRMSYRKNISLLASIEKALDDL